MRSSTYFLVLGFIALFGISTSNSMAASIAYIHGDVARDGTVPSGDAEPYDQMLLEDDGDTGLSMFKSLVEGQGHTISQHYDADTDLTASFLTSFDVVIFGLHQKLWSAGEKAVLDSWLNAGGGMLIYSDSASGGRFNIVGAQNPVGQTVTNNLIAQYGMQVTVDQANGVRANTVVNTPLNILTNGLVLEGEGVSPVAYNISDANVDVLIPFTQSIPHEQNITIPASVREYASLAIAFVGAGHVSVMFDRQPMWNDGPGSSIQMGNNEEILRRMINYLASPASQQPPPSDPKPFPIVGAIMLLLD